jgi:hypothetical protein
MAARSSVLRVRTHGSVRLPIGVTRRERVGRQTESIYRRYNIVSARDLQLATAKLEFYLKSENGAVSGRNEENAEGNEQAQHALTK